MSAANSMTLDPEQLNPTDRAILDELLKGRVTPAFVAEKHEYSSGNVRNRMTNLANHDHVRGLGGGLYELADDPREDVATEGHDLRAQLQDVLEARDDAQDRAQWLADEVDDLEALLADCHERLIEQDTDVEALTHALDDIEAACERGDSAALQDALRRAREAVGDA